MCHLICAKPFSLGFPDETWPLQGLQSGSSSGEPSGSGEAQGEALWWGSRLQMALVNTVAFRGVWQKQFLFINTQNLPFTLTDGSVIKVPMMYQATEVNFGKILMSGNQSIKHVIPLYLVWHFYTKWPLWNVVVL